MQYSGETPLSSTPNFTKRLSTLRHLRPALFARGVVAFPAQQHRWFYIGIDVVLNCHYFSVTVTVGIPPG
jgi:hypothetical protein